MMTTGVCIVAGCARPTYQSPIYCGAHRARRYRYGDGIGTPPPRRRADLTGQRFGALTVLEYSTGRQAWRCRCDCGLVTTVPTGSLNSGGTRSCGIRRRHVVPTSYDQMHEHLRAVRGSALEHACARCGQPAQQWSYRRRGALHRIDSSRGPWSPDLDDYEPACVSCHKRADLHAIEDERAAHHGRMPLW
jgi:hypothetical protein